MGSLAFAIQLLDVVPGLIASGVSVASLIAGGKERLELMQAEKRDPTDAEWQELNDRIAALRKELHAE